jgi:hypothetical protein
VVKIGDDDGLRNHGHHAGEGVVANVEDLERLETADYRERAAELVGGKAWDSSVGSAGKGGGSGEAVGRQ